MSYSSAIQNVVNKMIHIEIKSKSLDHMSARWLTRGMMRFPQQKWTKQ
jgi:hypothetical protein